MTHNPFNWRETPFVRLILPFILGIVCAVIGEPQTTIASNIILLLSACCTIFLWLKPTTYRWRWLFGIPLSIVLFLLGFQSTFYHNELTETNHFKSFLDNTNEKIVLGIVTDYVEKPTNHRCTISVQQLGSHTDSLHDVSGNLLLYIRKDSLQNSPPQYGDLIVLHAAISEIEPPKNPDAFDFKRYLHFQNIHFQSFAKQENIKILASRKGNPLIHTIKNWQQKLIYILKNHLKTEREFAVGSALILGYRDAITDEVRDAYVETGSMHILAVSGMHILLIFNGFNWFLSFYKTGNRHWRQSKAGISIVLIWLFTLLTGAGASVLRAAVMATFLAIGNGWGRQMNIYNILAASAFALLLWNPFWLFDVGFQLSYLAVLGIVFFQPKLSKLLIINNKIFRYAWEATTVGLAAQIVVTPISLYYFHQFPTYFWLSGLLAVPVSSGALYAGVGLFFFHQVPFLSEWLGKILFCLVWAMNEIVFFIQKLPLSIVTGIWLSLVGVLSLYLVLFGIAVSIKTHLLRTLIYPLSLLTILSVVYAFASIKKIHHREIIVYHIYRNSVVDFIDGEKCYSFSEKFSEKSDTFNKIKFATENHRLQLRINTLENYNFKDYVKNEHLLHHYNISQFYGHTLVILDKLPPKGVFLQVNTILICKNARINISDITQSFRFDTIIFDGSNARWRIERWKNECHNLGIPFHNTSEQGAWVKKLTK
ncbi:MAG: ComEC/Rec2 family competence protein [Saprospiraceae bacterium]|nr:ComEC/Rec2 family competence protein [Saprospiraceae bacterium]